MSDYKKAKLLAQIDRLADQCCDLAGMCAEHGEGYVKACLDDAFGPLVLASKRLRGESTLAEEGEKAYRAGGQVWADWKARMFTPAPASSPGNAKG